ncbi:hypothetical protein LZ31DRAFT_546516 [Colletotrichum somersetense]|nr:hypothetical protein LZ31DRAFT_546516 [Colletotrichum somersetense]
MAFSSNTATLDAQNADAYQDASTTTTGQAQGTTQQQPVSRAAASTVGGGDAATTHSGGIGQQIKGAFAQGHGVGEVLRGKFNSAVDTAAGDPQGQAKNKEIATGGEREFATKDFVKKGTLDKAL